MKSNLLGIVNHEEPKRKKIRLLHIVNSLGVGGAEVLLLHYIKALGIEEYDHFVYYFGPDGPIRGKIEALGIPVYKGKERASIKNPIRFCLTLFLLIQNLLSYIKNRRIQFIQSHLRYANHLAVTVGKLSGVPTFPTIHNTMPFLDRRSIWDPRVYILKAVDAIIYRVADRILVVSEEIKDIIRQKFRLEDSKITVLKNGIVIEDDLYEPVNLEKEFSISENTLKIIAVGRLSYQKAFEVLVSAAATLKTLGMKNIFVMIVGEGEDREQLEKLISDLGLSNWVELLGIRSDVIGLMKTSDIFVMPSRFEGLSIAMIEAMACGLPIIASDAPGLRTFIKHGQNGLLFPVEDHDALAKLIIELAEDRNLRVRLSHQARASFEMEYDMRKNIKTLYMLFRKYAATNYEGSLGN